MARLGVVTCIHCQTIRELNPTDLDWPLLRITYMPDERGYLTWPCDACGEWQAHHLTPYYCGRIIAHDVAVEDLSEIDPTLEADTMDGDPDAAVRLDLTASHPRLLDLAIDDVIHRSRPRRKRRAAPPKGES